MTIAEAQSTVDQWIKTTGVRYFNELTNTAMLMEEVGEWLEYWRDNMVNNRLNRLIRRWI